MSEPLSLVFLGLSITSSWGNGHATTYRSLIKGLAQRGHRVLFLERDVPWYRDNRDAPRPEGCSVALYASTEQLKQRHRAAIEGADAVIVGSYVPDGVEIGAWVQQVARGVRAFYDIDTPVTLRKLGQGDTEYLSPATIPGYDVYFSFSGGPALDLLVRDYGARRALPLYCSVDPDHYYPEAVPLRYDLGYLGTYSADRQPTLEALLLEPARRLADRRFVVAGPSYPAEIDWPPNVERIQHLNPAEHRAFYNAQRFTLNVTRADMVALGWSPSVRLFEAAACGVAIISDVWPGIETILDPGRELLLAGSSDEIVERLASSNEAEARHIGARARARVLCDHTSHERARQLEDQLQELLFERARSSRQASRPERHLATSR